MRARQVCRVIVALVAVLSFSAGCRREEEPSFQGRAFQGREGDRAGASERRAVAEEEMARPRERPTPVQARPQGAEGPRPAPEAPPLTEQPTPPALLTPAQVTGRAPERFAVVLDTTEGEIRMDVTRAWSPNGADRLYALVRAGYYTNVAFFRVIRGFMAQVGIHGDPRVNAAWRDANIPDDPVTQHNTRGMVSFATAGPGTRTTQFFINFGDNARLDDMGFSPFARIDERSMAIVDRLYAEYGEGAPSGRGPMQARMQREGNTYLRAEFPGLDYIRSARIVE
jgi:peptidyl-prolyl cis-trans isomerase A (cyclophilin A)